MDRTARDNLRQKAIAEAIQNKIDFKIIDAPMLVEELKQLRMLELEEPVSSL